MEQGQNQQQTGAGQEGGGGGQSLCSFYLICEQLPAPDAGLLVLLPGGELELDEVPGRVVVDVVGGVDGGGAAPVVVDGGLVCAGGGGGPGGAGPQGPVEGGVVHRPVAHRVSVRPLGDLDDDPHVVGGAVAADPPVQVGLGGGGDEVVALARPELHAPGGGREGAEGDGEVLEVLLLLADGHNLGPGAAHPAVVEVLDGDAVDDVLLHGVLGTHQVKLVVLPGQVVLVHVDDVVGVVYTEYWVGAVPVDKVCLHCAGDGGQS